MAVQWASGVQLWEPYRLYCTSYRRPGEARLLDAQLSRCWKVWAAKRRRSGDGGGRRLW